MIYIKKGKEPASMTQKVAQIKATDEWKNKPEKGDRSCRWFFDQLDKGDIRKSILAEQHNICAYCMRRIYNDPNTTTIEHIVPVKKSKGKSLDYKNMLCVCDGGAGVPHRGGRVLCCDASKGDEDQTINPLDKNDMETIYYTRDGMIRSRNSKYDKELNDILHLNGKLDENGRPKHDTATQLVGGRKMAYEICCKYMSKVSERCNGKSFAATLNKRIQELKDAPEYQEYIGVTLYLLERRASRG